MGNYATREDLELIENTSTRVPVCVCIDTSGSMSNKDDTGKSRIDRVKDGVDALFDAIRRDEMAKYSAEICIVGFNTEPYVVRTFSTLQDDEKGKKLPIFSSGSGHIGIGVSQGLELLQARKQKYKETGTDYYQPWLIIMSDGHSTAETKAIANQNLAKAQKDVLEQEANKKLVVVPVYIGDKLAEDQKALRDLGGFSKKNGVQEISSTRFADFFVWLGKSVSKVANEGDTDEVDFSDLFDWSLI